MFMFMHKGMHVQYIIYIKTNIIYHLGLRNVT